MDVVFVDWHKTLSTSLFWEHRPGCRLPPEQLAEVSRHVFSQHQLVRAWMLGAVAAEDISELAGHALELRTEDVLGDLEHSCRRMELCDRSVLDMLRSVRRGGIKVVLATDNMDAFRRWTLPALHLGTVFDAVLTSDVCGALKADMVDGHSPFFTPWLADHGIAPSQAILLDDCRVLAAEAIGIAARLVEDPGKLKSMLAQLVHTDRAAGYSTPGIAGC
jgi:FMN phosphatase YigB (HAD superfamily)